MDKKKITKTIAQIATVASAATAGVYHEEAIDIAQGNEHYLITQTGPSVLNIDAPLVERTRAGLVVKINAKRAAELEAQGVEIQKERIYRMTQIPGCTPLPKPGDPNPGPGDPVNPDPNPVTDKVPWGTSYVKAIEALKEIRGRRVKVAVLDTGVSPDHEDLKGTVVDGRSFIRGNTSWHDDQGHGTHVASTIAALKNGRGMIGVAAGVADIMAGKVLGRDGSGTSSGIASGLYWACDNGAEVVNMSLGSPRQYGPDRAITQAVRYCLDKGIDVVAAAGNDGSNGFSSGVGYPAASDPRVIAVSASDSSGRLGSFSDYGPEIDHAAPGVHVMGANHRDLDGYLYWDGTSMATPHVAAVYALCRAVSCKGVKTLLLPGLDSNKQGQGVPNALETIRNR